MDTEEIFNQIYSIAECYHSHEDQLKAIAKWIDQKDKHEAQTSKKLREFVGVFVNEKNQYNNTVDEKYNKDYVTVDLNLVGSYNPSTIKNTTTIRLADGDGLLLDIPYADFKAIMIKEGLEQKENLPFNFN